MNPKSKKESWLSQNKSTIILAFICLLIIALVVIIVIGHNRQNKTNETTTAVSTTQAVSTTVNSSQTALTAFKKDGQYYLIDPEKDPADEEGLWSYHQGIEYAVIPSISKKPNFYYFEKDHFSKNGNGLYPYGDDYYYIKNGVCDRNFTGFVSYENYMRYVRNGKWDQNFNGTFYDSKTDESQPVADVRNGVLYGIELGRPDGFTFTWDNWHVKEN